MMCCKKWVGGLAALAVVALGLTIFSATDAGSWAFGVAKVKWQQMWAWTQKQVTPEDEIARIGNEVKDLDEDIDVQYDKIVTQQREVEKSGKLLVDLRKKVDEQWQTIKLLQTSVEDAKAKGTSFVTFESKKSDLSVARKELSERWEGFKKAKATLDSKEAQLAEQKNTLAALNENRNEMMKAKDEYLVKLEQLKAQLEAIKAAETRNGIVAGNSTFNSRMARVQESMDKISDQLDVMSKKVAEQGRKLTVKNDTGAAQTVQNDIAEDEIRKYEDGLNKITADK